MLVVKVELWPLGDEGAAYEIARGTIINDGTGTSKFGNYRCGFLEGDKLVVDSEVKGYERFATSAWELLRRALS